MDTNKSYLKLRSKKSMFGALKAIAYCIGFPALVLGVIFGSVQFMHFGVFNSTWYLGIVIALIPWVLCSIVQIVLGRVSASQYLKTLVVCIIAVVLVLGGAGVLDLYMSKEVEKLTAHYAECANDPANPSYTTVEIPTYKYMTGHYVAITKDFESELDMFSADLNEFCMIYNVHPYGLVKNDENLDGTVYTLDKNGIPMNPNGLVSENYLYSPSFAVKQMLDYYRSENAMLKNGWTKTVMVSQQKVDGSGNLMVDATGKPIMEDVPTTEKMTSEDIYQALISKVEASAEYAEYKTTEEYLNAYSTELDSKGNYKGTAYRHMIDTSDVQAIVPVLVRYLETAIKYSDVYADITNIAAIKLLLPPVLQKIIATSQTPGVTVEDLVASVRTNVIDMISGLAPDVVAPINAILDQCTTPALTALLMDINYYYAPTVKPSFSFINTENLGATDLTDGTFSLTIGENTAVLTADELNALSATLHTYAYARYYCKVNGAYIGSVLVPNNDVGLGKLLNAEGRVGMITLDANGYDGSKVWTIERLEELEVELDYIPRLYPLLAARRFMYISAAFIAIGLVLFYQFGRRQDEVIEEMSNLAKGGASHE